MNLQPIKPISTRRNNSEEIICKIFAPSPKLQEEMVRLRAELSQARREKQFMLKESDLKGRIADFTKSEKGNARSRQPPSKRNDE